METFFNESVAASLQYFTFPLELIGVTLALIELRFPKTAAYLTRQIERASMPLQALRSGSDAMIERSLATLLTRLLTLGYVILSAIYAVTIISRLIDRGFEPEWLIGVFINYLVVAVILTVALVILGLTLFFVVIGGSDFARRFVAGRAIGTLGIIIAGLGLLGELYQFLHQIAQ